MPSLHAGDLLARRYRLIDRIGAGGMSVIWRAHDEALGRIVAVKVLAAELAADARFRAMVRDEARAAAQLVHPHVTAVHDYGETIAGDGDVTAFVVMELLDGESLEARLTGGPLPWAEAVEICAQVAQGLAAAHRIGIVHRDVTPANIMMTATGAKVLDFGIAARVGAPDEDEEGDSFGTPAYVAPERLDGRPAQPATDTYSLGVLLYETLTGRPPYPVETWDDLTEALRNEIPPLTGVPGLPPPVAEICLRCLSHDPVERPTARQVGAALRGQLRPADQGTPSSPRRVAGLVAAGALALAAAFLVGSAVHRPPSDARGPNPSTAAPASPPPTGTASAVPGAPSPAGSRPAAPHTGMPSVRGTLDQVGDLITEGVADGAIRPDAGTDLQNLLRNLRSALTRGAVDPTRAIAELREKVAVRATEGAITDAYADGLDAALARLACVDC
ncbi:serine/threonine-protein kinase [Micromonospora sp. NPDC049679]|uniref:serine/threonine-protein kinase n=1 Tax=Micromonospora sp. NPDC049679 TaxID=3155920 RepID=UPI003401F120